MARQNWLDDAGQTTLIDDYAKKIGSFIDALADGRIDQDELATQERRVVDLMKTIEPDLDDATHAKLTELLCELSAFNSMQLLFELHEARPKSQFQG